MSENQRFDEDSLPPETGEVARKAMGVLDGEGIPFLVSGAYAYAYYTGVERHTKDFDICVKADDIDRALEALEGEGFRTEVPSPVWLAKARIDDQLVDLVFNSGHGQHPVDESWFRRARQCDILERTAMVVPVEELICSKAFIMERERFDGADVAHLLRCGAEQMDWDHLLAIFGEHWHVLLSHLVLYQYIYPAHRDRVPEDLLAELSERFLNEREEPPPDEDVCRGTMLSRSRYLVDIDRWGGTDGRVDPHGALSPEQARRLSPRGPDGAD